MTGLFPREVSESRRVATCCTIGIVAAGLCEIVQPWQFALVIGWNAAAAALLLWLRRDVWDLDATATRAFSEIDDETRRNAAFVVVVGSGTSLAAVILGVINARSESTAAAAVTVAACVVAVALSFAVVHSVFALLYLHDYFDGGSGNDGGIQFPGNAEPCASDFAYFAFTIGMSFAVSDAELTSAPIRRKVLAHAVVSYVFASAILGLSINLFAGLVG